MALARALCARRRRYHKPSLASVNVRNNIQRRQEIVGCAGPTYTRGLSGRRPGRPRPDVMESRVRLALVGTPIVGRGCGFLPSSGVVLRRSGRRIAVCWTTRLVACRDHAATMNEDRVLDRPRRHVEQRDRSTGREGHHSRPGRDHIRRGIASLAQPGTVPGGGSKKTISFGEALSSRPEFVFGATATPDCQVRCGAR